MTDEEMYEKARKEIENFLNNSNYRGFEMWRSSVIDLQRAFESTVPYDSRRGGIPALYEAGYDTGERTGEWLVDTFDLQEKSIKERTHYTDALFPLIGLGEMKFLKGPETILRFEDGTFFAKEYDQLGRNVCDYVAGFIAGATKALTGTEVEVTEIECVARGDDNCDFRVEPKDK